MPDMMKVQPDIGTIFANLNSAGVDGAIKQYCMARINGAEITPDLAKSAFIDAKKLVDAAESANSDEVSIGEGKTVAVDILEALLNDISMFAKVAASRQTMLKLADKFAAKVR